MAERAIGRLSKNGNSYTVAVPRPLLHRLGWVRGTRLLLEVRDGCFVVAPLDEGLARRALDRVPPWPPRSLEEPPR